MGKKNFTILHWSRVYTCQNAILLEITLWLKYAWWPVNPLPNDSAFWCLWNTMYLEIPWKKSICSIGANAPVSILFSKVFKTLLKFSWFFSMLSKYRKWCHDLKIAYEVKGKCIQQDKVKVLFSVFSDEEAQPIRVREPDVVEPVVPQAAPEEAIIPEPVRVEPVVPVPPASSSVIGRVAGGMLSATGYMVTLPIRIGIGAVTLPFRMGRSVLGVFIGWNWIRENLSSRFAAR